MFTNLFFSLFIFPWRNYTNSKSNNECLLERGERALCAIQTEWIEKNVNRHHRAVISLSESKHEIALHSLHFVLFCNRYKLREWRMGNEFIFCHVKIAHLHKKSFKNSNYLSSRNTNGVERDGKQQKIKNVANFSSSSVLLRKRGRMKKARKHPSYVCCVKDLSWLKLVKTRLRHELSACSSDD